MHVLPDLGQAESQSLATQDYLQAADLDSYKPLSCQLDEGTPVPWIRKNGWPVV
jgi:hypothetical protein